MLTGTMIKGRRAQQVVSTKPTPISSLARADVHVAHESSVEEISHSDWQSTAPEHFNRLLTSKSTQGGLVSKRGVLPQNKWCAALDCINGKICLLC